MLLASTLTPAKLIAAVSPAAGSGSDIPLGGIAPISDAYSKGSAVGTGALANAELFISNIIGFLTFIGGIFFLIYFFLGTLNWITAGGDKGKVEKARTHITNGALGVIVMVAAYAMVGLIGSMLGLDILNVGTEFTKLIPTGVTP
jgi:hypothetical protein